MTESRSLFWVTVAAAAVAMVLPWPEWMQPYWPALVLIYWSLESRGRVSLGRAFVIGLFLDVLSASLLGQHALSLVILTYLVERFRNQIRFASPWQQGLSVLALLLNDRVVLLWIAWLRGEFWPGWAFWLPPLFGALLWPLIFIGLDRVRQRTRRRSAE